MSRIVAVAVSGGRDSMALLHCTARAAAGLGLEVVALHVHHGLMPEADAWATFVERCCMRWARQRDWPLRCAVTRVQGTPQRGDSVEAWARKARYNALGAMARAQGADLVLLAHHRSDQAETFLLQALRGAGPAGLAAMPALVHRKGITWARPWLAMPCEAVAAYARRHRLRFVDDPSNADPRFARSRLRHDAMPALCAAFPDAEAALAAAASQAAQARALADEMAAVDLAAVVHADALVLGAWRELPPARRRNALRAWLDSAGITASAAKLERLMLELPAGTQPATWTWPGATVRRYRGAVRIERDAAQPRIRLRPAEEGGVPASLLQGAQWQPRQGGERFQRAVGTPPRSLKKQFQAAGVPAWSRDAPLLVDAQGRLVFVPGLGLDARATTQPGTPRVSIEWDEDAATPR